MLDAIAMTVELSFCRGLGVEKTPGGFGARSGMITTVVRFGNAVVVLRQCQRPNTCWELGTYAIPPVWVAWMLLSAAGA